MGILVRTAIVIATGGMLSAVMPDHADAQTTLPPITVEPAPPRGNAPKDQGSAAARGSDLKDQGGAAAKGNDGRTLERLNRQLKRKVDEANPIGNIPPLDANSPDTKTGVVNIPGVQQQYGKNFGNSVIPYRPTTVYTPPLGGRR
ncbi:hypothetical protein [Bradyrhizobium genosp. A]|uniref:hypothetical protein n=1 Tax=Bradyrhizobium genosp. A TaxID=83626 RepID=UPI003CEA2EE2